MITNSRRIALFSSVLASVVSIEIARADVEQCVAGLAEKVDYTSEVMDSLSSAYKNVAPNLRSGYGPVDIKMALFAEKIGVDPDEVFSAYKALRSKISFGKAEEALSVTKMMFKYQKKVEDIVDLYFRINQGISLYNYTHRQQIAALTLQAGGDLELVKNAYQTIRNQSGFYNYKRDIIGLTTLAIKLKRPAGEIKNVYDQVRSSNQVYGNHAMDVTKAILVSNAKIEDAVGVYSHIRASSKISSDHFGVITLQALTSKAPLEGILNAYVQIRNENIYSWPARQALLTAFTKFGVKPENALKVYRSVRSQFSNFSYDYGAITLHTIAEGYPIGIDGLTPEQLQSAADVVETGD